MKALALSYVCTVPSVVFAGLASKALANEAESGFEDSVAQLRCQAAALNRSTSATNKHKLADEQARLYGCIHVHAPPSPTFSGGLSLSTASRCF